MDKKEGFAAEIAKQIPIKEIYNDVAHPALSTVGEGPKGARHQIENQSKTIRNNYRI